MIIDREGQLRFLGEEDGNVTIFSVLMLVLILTITGASVDIMRLEATRVQMQATMDRAVLAAADLDQMQDPSDVVTDYVAKAGLGPYLGNVSITDDANERLVDASAATQMDTLFLHMAGFDMLEAAARSVAEESISNVEISLVLDISGSMRFNSRMDRLRPAAKNFLEKVMVSNDQGVTTLNLVPFSGHVNPGGELFDYFRGVRPNVPVEEPEENDDHFPAWPQAISNIVMYFDTDGDDIFDRAHKIEGFPESAPRDVDDFVAGAVGFAIEHDAVLNSETQFLGISIKGGQSENQYFSVWGDSNGPESDLGPTKNTGKLPGSTYSYGQIDFDVWEEYYPVRTYTPSNINVNLPSSCVEIYNDEFATTALPLSDDMVPHFHYWQTDETVMDWGWCPEEDTAIQYYSSDVEALKQFVDDIRMHDGTGVQYGMKYALALLDPATRDAVSHLIDEGLIDARFQGRPIDWFDPETEKYVVIMTDGKVTDQYRPVDEFAAINGEVELQSQGAGATYTMEVQSTNLTNLQIQCDLARELGVVVFAIAFETDESAAADMRACASSESHFFHVEGEEIYDTFDIVARQINNLRLVQ